MAAGLAEPAEIEIERWRAEVAQYLPLIARVIVQTRRRVLDGEIVPASEKLVSLFERMPTSSSKAVVRFSMVTSST